MCVGAAVSTIEVDNMDSLMNQLDGCCRGRVHQCAVGTIGVDNAIKDIMLLGAAAGSVENNAY